MEGAHHIPCPEDTDTDGVMIAFPQQEEEKMRRKRVKIRHWLTLLSGFMDNLCFSGIVYGWASLVFVLKADGFFAHHCVNTTLGDNVTKTDCSAQDEKFSMVMSMASFCNNIARFPLGYVFDRFGTAVTRLLAISLYTSGTLFIASSRPDQSVLLFPALSCLMTSGTLFYTSNAQVANLFDGHRSTVINIYTGAFDASAAVFLMIKLLHGRGGSLQTLFFLLSSCCVLHLLSTIFLMPRGHIPYPVPPKYNYGLSCRGRRRREEEEEEGEVTEMKADVMETCGSEERAAGEGASLKEQPKLLSEQERVRVPGFRSCVLSLFFLWHLLWMAIIQFSHFLFLGTINPKLNKLANSDQNQVGQYTNAFGLIQICGVLCSPFNGLILDRHKRRPLAPGETRQEAEVGSFPLSLFLTSLQCVLFCACFSIPVLPLQYLTFALQVINSSFLYGGHQAFIITVFPSCHFGKLSGLIMSLSSLMLLLQFPVLQVIQQWLDGDPLYVFVSLAILSLLTFIHPLHIHLHCRERDNQRRAKLEVDLQ